MSQSKLSKLQKFILSKAAELDRVYYADVCEGFYGWAPVSPIRRYQAGDSMTNLAGQGIPIPAKEIGCIQGPGDQKFSRKAIGEKEYTRVMAAISRSVMRLGQRGLVTCICGSYSRWSGVQITDSGRECVMVNLNAKLPQS